MILSYASILPVSLLRTQQVMMSLIRSHIEYLIQTHVYACAHFVVEIDEQSSLDGEFSTRFNDDS